MPLVPGGDPGNIIKRFKNVSYLAEIKQHFEIHVVKKVKTPCIGVCSTGIGDDVCRGCKRFANEVIEWNGYTDEQKRNVIRRLDSLLAQVVNARMVIFDRERLKAEMKAQQIRFDDSTRPETWVYTLLKAGASQIRDLTEFGCQLLPEWRDKTLVEIRETIDADFYTLSRAHYERYFRMEKI